MRIDYRPDDPTFLADPFPLFRRMQDEDPCHWSPRASISDAAGAPHLAFGFGMHICLGFPLARLEGQTTLPAVLAHWLSLELADVRLEWLNSMVFRGIKSMPVRVRG